MRVRIGVMAVAASLAFASTPASAFTALYSFGDSLSDVGNVYAATAGTYPIAPYYFGRFSNGPNWVDDLSAKLGLGAVSPSASGGNDFAVGGAQTGPTIVNPGVPLVDLNQQVQEFQILKSSPAAGALYTLDIGANDIGNALGALASNKIASADLMTFLAQAVGNTVTAVDQLFADGARELLYYEAPDLSVVPAFKVFGTLAGTLAKTFNDGVLAGLQPLEKQGLTVFDIPVYSKIDQIVTDPGKFGFTNVTDPCFSGDFQTPGTECANPDQYLFWDHEHPTAAGHAITADIAYDLLTAPVPTPAPEPSTWVMALIGFAVVAFAACRRRPRRATAAIPRQTSGVVAG
jgi:phospholipase/lecithinase/hemolysin